MKKNKSIIFLLLLILVSVKPVYSQDLIVIPGDTVISGIAGSEMISFIHLINVSRTSQIIFLIRTENNLPGGWTSSLCYTGSCYSPNIDSIISSEPLYSGDTAEASLHFSTDKTNPGTALVQIQFGTFNNSFARIIINLTVSTLPTAVKNQDNETNEFNLKQNFPNPFNPSTSIQYAISNRQFVVLKVFDVLGNEIATLVNEEKTKGSYVVNWNAGGLASGVYFYQLQAGKFKATKKLLLLK